jgi:cytochrome c553
MRHLIAGLTSILIATGCGKKPPEPQAAPSSEPEKASPPPSAAPAAAAPPVPSQTPTLPAHMAEHFTKAASIKAALIRGDLEAMRKDADWMATHELSRNLPETWRPYLQAMQTTAQRVVKAKDAAGAALAVAEMGQACGTCHKALGGPKLEVGSPPAEGSGVAPHMMGHQWAADRMWEGLIGPSDPAWIKGSEMLASAPLTEKAVAGQKSVPPEVELLAQKVHGFGEKSRAAAATDRVALYGDFLATCASCHEKVGVKK